MNGRESLRKRLADLFCDEVQQICDRFEAHGYQVRIIGGAVRDSVIGQAPNDIDLVTDCPEVEFQKISAGLGTKPPSYMHNTATGDSLTVLQIYFGGHPYELVPLRPLENIAGDPWFRDAACRDFTFNAMSASRDGELHDYFGGAEDLRHNRVRWIGCIRDRITEVPFRILRYFRFRAEMQSWGRDSHQVAPHDPSVLAEMSVEKAQLQKVHGQVLWKLLKQIISSSSEASRGELNAMHEYGFLGEIFPYEIDLERAHVVRRFQEECAIADEVSKATLYLPKILDGKIVLFAEDEETWRATNEHIKADTSGLTYRESKSLDAKVKGNRFLVWGKTIKGLDEGDNWVRIELKAESCWRCGIVFSASDVLCSNCGAMRNPKVEPVTIIAALLRWNSKWINTVSSLFKWSAAESGLGKLLCSVHSRDLVPSLQTCFCELWVDDGFKWRRNLQGPDGASVAQAKGWMQQVLVSQGFCTEMDSVNSLRVPELPVEICVLQQFLVSRTGVGADGKFVMQILKELRQIWVAGGCQSTGNQLLEQWWPMSRLLSDFNRAAHRKERELQSVDELSAAMLFYIRGTT